MHDYNTIALNPDYGINVMACALLHEFEHLTNANGPGGGNGTGGDDRVGEPCWECIHASMTAASWTSLHLALCEGTALVDDYEECFVLQDLEEIAEAQHADCESSACPDEDKPVFEDLADWDAACIPCTV